MAMYRLTTSKEQLFFIVFVASVSSGVHHRHAHSKWAVPSHCDILKAYHLFAAINSDAVNVLELAPNHNVVKRLADAEHKARRSLMHR